MKEYKKPVCISYENIKGLVPLAAAVTALATELAPAAALVGGYAVGRSVKNSFSMHIDGNGNKGLRPVVI